MASVEVFCMRVFLPALMVSACGGGFVDSSPRCGHEVFDWFGGLVMHLEQGEDFSFNYDPRYGNVDKVAGGYITENTNTDFYWYTTYTDGYYLSKSTTQGIGTAYQNGDLDVLYAEDVEDVLGDTWRNVVREERGGCSGRIASLTTDTDEALKWAALQADIIGSNLVVDYSIVSPERVEYTSVYESSSAYRRVRTGAWTSDFRDSYSETWEDGQSEGTGEMAIRADGTYSESFWQVFPGNAGDLERIGTTDGRFNGGMEQELTQGSPNKIPDWYIQASYDYDGSGEATWTHKDGTVCDLTFKANGNCTYTCDDGGSGDC
jgi:hypothetical protein